MSDVKTRSDVHHEARSALAKKLSTLTTEEARELAEELRVAMYGHRMDFLRALDALVQLGVKFPPGLT